MLVARVIFAIVFCLFFQVLVTMHQNRWQCEKVWWNLCAIRSRLVAFLLFMRMTGWFLISLYLFVFLLFIAVILFIAPRSGNDRHSRFWTEGGSDGQIRRRRRETRLRSSGPRRRTLVVEIWFDGWLVSPFFRLLYEIFCLRKLVHGSAIVTKQPFVVPGSVCSLLGHEQGDEYQTVPHRQGLPKRSAGDD